MYPLMIVVFVFFVMAGNVLAEPVVLKCVASDATEMVDLTIDLTKKEMRWGNDPKLFTAYDIIHVNETYISAYERPHGTVGGEIWVINRTSGEFKRAYVGIFFSRPGTSEQGKWSAITDSGRCVKPQF